MKNNLQTEKGVVAKVLISFVLLFLTGLGCLIYFANRTDDLVIYPNLKGETIEIFIKNDKTTLDFIKKHLAERKTLSMSLSRLQKNEKSQES